MLSINIWGSRGSVSVSGASFVRHGGATTCLEIVSERDRIILDCGTGIADLGRTWGGRGDTVTLLQSHFHWDHLQGFPFFVPFYNPGFSARLWAVEREEVSFRETLEAQMCPPRFPVGLEVLRAGLEFAALPTRGRRDIGSIEVSWAEMQHPSGSTAFRFSDGEHSAVISGDVEVEMGCEPELVELSRGADVLIMDSQYLPEDYDSKRGFGHSTFEHCVRVARAAGVKELVLTHHDPGHDDRRLDSKLARARALAGPELVVSNAYDGLALRLGEDARTLRQSA